MSDFPFCSITDPRRKACRRTQFSSPPPIRSTVSVTITTTTVRMIPATVVRLDQVYHTRRGNVKWAILLGMGVYLLLSLLVVSLFTYTWFTRSSLDAKCIDTHRMIDKYTKELEYWQHWACRHGCVPLDPLSCMWMDSKDE